MKFQLPRALPGSAAWSLLGLIVLWSAGMPFYFADLGLLLASAAEAPASYQWATAANTLLAASTALYVANLWFASDSAGRLASWLAGLGAAGLLADILIRAALPELAGRSVMGLERGSFEVSALFVALAVGLWLVAEWVLRAREAGAFVMPVVMCGVAAQIWLINGNSGGSGLNAFSGLSGYWGQAFVMTQVIGYGAFLLTALLGILYLIRSGLEPGDRLVQRLPDPWRLYGLMVTTLMIGLPVFALATLMLGGWSLDSGDSLSRSTWTLLVLGVYGALAWLLFRRPMQGLRLAWWSIVGFGVTLVGFIAVHLMPLAPSGFA
ncbi:MAG TPA: hypothetical protein VLC55_01725 [Burkholderiales bacterium]|nr:hypothetical protein [Burkholderiales bacterium]